MGVVETIIYTLHMKGDEILEEFEPELYGKQLEEFDALVEYFKTFPRHETFVLNPSRMLDIRTSYALMTNAIREADCDAKITCGHGELGATYGYVEIEGKYIEIANMGCFLQVTNLATNAEVYPLTNGKVRMTFTFYDLLRPI